jgi:hypothetical protein
LFSVGVKSVNRKLDALASKSYPDAERVTLGHKQAQTTKLQFVGLHTDFRLHKPEVVSICISVAELIDALKIGSDFVVTRWVSIYLYWAASACRELEKDFQTLPEDI